MVVVVAAMLQALLATIVAGSTTPSWSASKCSLSGSSTETAAVWFADVGEKVFLADVAPTATCGQTLRLSAARGEHATFQVAVRPSGSTALTGVRINLIDLPDRATLDIRRAAFTNVTTAANNVSSSGTGMYPDPLPYPNDTTIFPAGGGTVHGGETAVFWLTLAVPADLTSAGLHTMQLAVAGTGITPHPLTLLVWNFTLPDAGVASQWTEADFGGALQPCNIIDEAKRPIGCSAARVSLFWIIFFAALILLTKPS